MRCLEEDRLGKFNDGGKVTCAISRLVRLPRCVVYSFGSNGDMSFEEDLDRAVSGNCEIHTFDSSPKFAELWEKTSKKMHYHALHLEPEGKNTLPEIMKALGHDHIDVLKTDIEGGEYDVMHKTLYRPPGTSAIPVPNIGQFIVEVHEIQRRVAWRTYALMANLEKRGLYQFHSETNPRNPYACRELSFINTTYPAWV